MASKKIFVDVGGSTTELDKALKSLQSSAKVTKSSLKEIETALEFDPANLDLMNKKFETLGQLLTNAEEQLKKATDAQEEYDKALAEKRISDDEYKAEQTAVMSLQNKVSKLQQSMVEYKTTCEGMNATLEQNGNTFKVVGVNAADAADSLDSAGKNASEAAEGFENAGQGAETAAEGLDEAGGSADSTAQSFQALSSAIAALGLAQVVGEIVDIIRDCTDSAMEFESAITGVYKTVDGTDEQLEAITEGIKDMALEIPLTTTELAGIAEAAGQLGIATDDILDFTQVIADLAVSTNLSAEDAATQIAKFANITGLAADEFSNFGSALVELGNTFATTESDTMNMAMRIASAGTQVGLTSDQILGFSAALSSVGLEAEAGGTAFSTMLKKISVAVDTGSDSLEKIAKVAGMTSDEFSSLWNTDVSSAITAFISGLKKLDTEGESTVTLLDDLGLGGIRTSDALTRLSSAATLVPDALETANTAFEENTALTEEAAKRYETAASKFELFGNALDQLKAAVGEDFLAAVTPAVEGLTDITAAAADLVDEYPAVSAAIGAIAAALAGFTTTALVANGIVAVKAAFVALSTATAGAALPIAAAVAAFAALSAAVIVYRADIPDANAETKAWAEEMDEAAKAVDNMAQSVEQSSQAFDEQEQSIVDQNDYVTSLINKVESLAAVENKSAGEKQELLNAIDELNTALPNLGLAYDDVTDSVNLTKQEMLDCADAAFKSAQLEALAERMKDLAKEQYDAEKTLADAQDAVTEATEKRLEAIHELYTFLEEHNVTDDQMQTAIANGTDNDLVRQYQDLREAVDITSETLDQANEKLITAKDTADGLGDSVSEVKDDYNDLSGSIETATDKTGDFSKKSGEAAESLDDLKSDLSDAQDDYDTMADNIEGVYDAIVTALKDQAKDSLETVKKSRENEYKEKKEACDEAIALYQEEHDEKIRLLEEDSGKTESELQGRIDEIEGRTEADKAAEEAKDWQEKLDEYASDTGDAYTELKESGSAASTALENYSAQQSAVSSKYAALIADAETAKAKAVADAEKAVADTTAKYEADLAALDKDSQEYAEKQYQMAKDLSALNSDLTEAQLGGDENINSLKKQQADEEAALAKSSRDTFVNAAKETNEISTKYVKEYNEEKLRITEEYNKKIAALEKSGGKTSDSNADKLAEYEESYNKALAKNEAAYAKNGASYLDTYNSEKLEIEQDYNEKVSKLRDKDSENATDNAQAIKDKKAELAEELSDLESSYKEKSKNDAVDAANDLADLEIERAEDVGEHQQSQVEAIRDKQVEAIETEITKAQDAADILQGKYDDILENQKTNEQAKLEAFKTQLDAANQVSEQNYQSYITSTQLQIDAYNTMLTMKTDEGIEKVNELLAEHNEGFANAGKTFSDYYAGGFSTMGETIQEKLGGTLDDALTYLNKKADEIKALWDKINGLQGTALVPISNEEYERQQKSKYADAPAITTDTNTGFPIKGTNLSTSGEASGKNYAEGLANGIEGGQDEVEDAAEELATTVSGTANKKLEVNSPSKVAYQTGAYYGEGLALGITESAEAVADAAEGLTESVTAPVDAAKDSIDGLDGSTESLGDSCASLGNISLAAAVQVAEMGDNAAAAMAEIADTAGSTDNMRIEVLVLNSYMEALGNTVLGLISTFKTFGEQVLNSLKELNEQIANIITAVGDSTGEIVKTLMELPDTLSSDDNLKKYYDAGQSAGRNYAAGLAEGLKGSQGDVNSAAADLAKGVINAVKEEHNTNSPSKVAEEQGLYYGEGLANGLTESAGKVSEAAAEIANSIKDAVSETLDEHSPSEAAKEQAALYADGLIQGSESKEEEAAEAGKSLAESYADGVAEGLEDNKPDDGWDYETYPYRRATMIDGKLSIWNAKLGDYEPMTQTSEGGYYVTRTQSEYDRIYGELDAEKSGEITGAEADSAAIEANRKLAAELLRSEQGYGEEMAAAIASYINNDALLAMGDSLDSLGDAVKNAAVQASLAGTATTTKIDSSGNPETTDSTSTSTSKYTGSGMISTGIEGGTSAESSDILSTAAIAARRYSLSDKSIGETVTGSNNTAGVTYLQRQFDSYFEHAGMILSSAQESMTRSVKAAYETLTGQAAAATEKIEAVGDITVPVKLNLDRREIANIIAKQQYKTTVTRARNKGVTLPS